MLFISYLRTRRRRRWSRKDPRPACDGSGRTFNTRFAEATESKATLRLRQAKRTGGGDGVCTAIRLRGGQLAACAGRSRAATHQTRSTRAPRITYQRRDIMVDAHYAIGEQCVNEAVAFAVAARMVELGAHHHASSQNSSKTSSFATALTAFACAWVALTTSSKR
jgi:hypothetical protein